MDFKFYVEAQLPLPFCCGKASNQSSEQVVQVYNLKYLLEWSDTDSSGLPSLHFSIQERIHA